MLASLKINSFRCFHESYFEFHPKFNFISGINGSGKTALLEAISLLSTGRSFRMRETHPLIQCDKEEMILLAKLHNGYVISLKKSNLTSSQIKINYQNCLRTSELTTFLPSQIIYQDLFEIVDAGPAIRRQLIDWGLFHVKQHYHQKLSLYKQALKQRNCLLKNKAKINYLESLDHTLSDLGEWIHTARQEYLDQLMPIFKNKLQALTSFDCDLIYLKGWDGDDLLCVLTTSYAGDIFKQYTQFGPQAADLQLQTEDGKIKHYLSRGQQKMVLLALKLAQAEILDKPCLYIWDDICSEIDSTHLNRLSSMIQQLSGQFFITGIDFTNSVMMQKNSGTVISL